MFTDCITIAKNDSGIYMIATLCLLIIIVFTLIAIYFMCPTDSRYRTYKTQQHKAFYNPELDLGDYLPKPKLASFTPTRPTNTSTSRPINPSNTRQNSTYLNNDKLISNINEELKQKYSNEVSKNNISTLANDNNKRERAVTFDFGKPVLRKSNTFNDFGTSAPYNSTNTINNTLARYGSKSILKRCSSSQELYQQKRNSGCLFNSMPDVYRMGKSTSNQCMSSTYQPRKTRSTNSLSKFTSRINPRSESIIEMDEDIDEGQIQCIISFDTERMLLTVRSLYIQTMLPAGIPGFIIEITIVPNKHDVRRSKVYMANEGEVNTYIEEIFQLYCTRNDLINSSLIISLKPVLGNVILYAETELGQLELLRKQRVCLAGFLKGVITHTN